MSNEELSKMQNQLDAIGLVTDIKKVGEKRYNLLLNFTIIKVRKQRRSLKYHILKLYSDNQEKIIENETKAL